jgi:hypothetical protein
MIHSSLAKGTMMRRKMRMYTQSEVKRQKEEEEEEEER